MIGFARQFQRFAAVHRRERPEMPVEWRDRWPRLTDRTEHLPFDAHYVYHTAWAARELAQIRPSRHVDISSLAYFSTLCSAFVPIEFYDYRPAGIVLPNLTCGAADLCALPFADGSIASLSCMHTIEHIGLGRYGDPLDARGDLRALAELERVLAPGGSLLVVVPVGRPRVQYNAHRIYDPLAIEQALPGLTLRRWALLKDAWQSGLVDNPSRALALEQSYGCGCFHFQRKA
jgi:SAM-dependent methyltransferase